MFSFTKRSRIAVGLAPVAAVTVALLSGCGSGSSSNTATTVRSVDAISSGTATVSTGVTPIAANQTFFQASKYISTTSGSIVFSFTLSDQPTIAYPTVTQTLNGGTPYSAILFGRSDVTDSTDARYPKLSVIVDDRTAPNSGKARYRVVHASPDLAAVDVIRSGTNLATNVGYTSISGYNDLAAGVESISVNQTGTSTVKIPTSTFTFNAGQLYTIYVVESLDTGSPVYTLQVTNDSL